MNHRHTIHKSKLFRLCTLLLLLALLCSCSDVSTGILSDPSDLPTPDAPAEDLPTNAEPTTPKKRVAITFDDGPQYANEGQNTQAIVDELNKYGFHATFFVVGNRIGNGKALSYAVQYGNEIGIHGYTHSTNRYYDKCTDEEYEDEINSTHNAILDVLPDYRIRLMRPVGGRITQARIDSSPYAVILWDVDSNDYNYKYNRNDTDEDCERKVAAIVENVMSQVEDGSIILMHDIYQSTFDATVIILQRLYEEGYEVVSVSELLGENMQPGRLYNSAYQ